MGRHFPDLFSKSFFWVSFLGLFPRSFLILFFKAFSLTRRSHRPFHGRAFSRSLFKHFFLSLFYTSRLTVSFINKLSAQAIPWAGMAHGTSPHTFPTLLLPYQRLPGLFFIFPLLSLLLHFSKNYLFFPLFFFSCYHCCFTSVRILTHFPSDIAIADAITDAL